MNPLSDFNDKINLKMHLKSTEGKGLTDGYINTLLKKKYFILTNNYELQEVLRIGIIFGKYFFNKGIIYNKLKLGLELILRCDLAIKYHFANDSLFSVRLPSILDNHINILLDQYENIPEPKNI